MDDVSREMSEGPCAPQDKIKNADSSQNPDQNVYSYAMPNPKSELPLRPKAHRLKIIDQEFNNFRMKVYQQGKEVAQILDEVNLEAASQ